MNCSKIKFMVINGSDYDRSDIAIDNITIEHCTKYIYLGAIIMEQASFSRFMDEHTTDKNKHLLKLFACFNKNCDLPVHMKFKILDACLLSTLLYSCESWFGTGINKLNTMYMAAVTCPNDICLVECGYPTLSALIKEKQYKYYRNITRTRAGMDDDPFMFMLSVARDNNTPGSRYIDSVMTHVQSSFIVDSLNSIKDNVRTANGSKFKTYCETNPEMIKHCMYTNGQIPEWHRIPYSRFRLSAHRLKVETGRWSRIPREARLCDCGIHQVQDEKHFIETCLYLIDLRLEYPNMTFELPEFHDQHESASFVYKAMNILNL